MANRFQIDESTLLRELTSGDAQRLCTVIDDNRTYLREWLPWVDGQKEAGDSLEFIERSRKENRDRCALTLGIEHEGEIVGVIGFHELGGDTGESSMGYWIAAGYQGKGIVTQSCRKLIEYAFHDLKLDRVVMRIAQDNLQSRKVAQRIGFSEEGIRRQSEWLYDHYVDQVIYVLDADEWFAH